MDCFISMVALLPNALMDLPMHSLEINTVLGNGKILFSAHGIHAFQFVDLIQSTGPAALPTSTASIALEWIRILQAVARGEVINNEIPLAPRGTPFQRKVWAEITTVPWGQTVNYGQIASAIGMPKAVRAVGVACGHNPIALLIPCHRVVRKDGSLGGYAWGIERKQQLLHQERRRAKAGRLV